jgi:hypothetical protein
MIRAPGASNMHLHLSRNEPHAMLADLCRPTNPPALLSLLLPPRPNTRETKLSHDPMQPGQNERARFKTTGR